MKIKYYIQNEDGLYKQQHQHAEKWGGISCAKVYKSERIANFNARRIGGGAKVIKRSIDTSRDPE